MSLSLKLDYFSISVSSPIRSSTNGPDLSLLSFLHIAPSLALLFCLFSLLQASPSEVTGNNTGLAWSGILGTLHLGTLKLISTRVHPNLYYTHISLAGPLVLFLPCPFNHAFLTLLILFFFFLAFPNSTQIPCSIYKSAILPLLSDLSTLSARLRWACLLAVSVIWLVYARKCGSVIRALFEIFNLILLGLGLGSRDGGGGKARRRGIYMHLGSMGPPGSHFN